MPVTNAASGIKAGTVAHFAASTAPSGWLKANGAAVSRTNYAALFLAIGTTYGAGDGATTFNVPDLRGEFVRGLDDGRGVDTGRAIGSAQAHQMQSHSHTQRGRGDMSISGGGESSIVNNSNISDQGTTGAAGGTSNGSENRPRNVALLACIKF